MLIIKATEIMLSHNNFFLLTKSLIFMINSRLILNLNLAPNFIYFFIIIIKIQIHIYLNRILGSKNPIIVSVMKFKIITIKENWR